MKIVDNLETVASYIPSYSFEALAVITGLGVGIITGICLITFELTLPEVVLAALAAAIIVSIILIAAKNMPAAFLFVFSSDSSVKSQSVWAKTYHICNQYLYKPIASNTQGNNSTFRIYYNNNNTSNQNVLQSTIVGTRFKGVNSSNQNTGRGTGNWAVGGRKNTLYQ